MPNSKTAIMTASGRYFDIHNPRVDDVCLSDVAHGLARTQRFGGQTLAPYELSGPLAVDSHSLRVARIGWHLCGSSSDSERIEIALALLLHDAAEAYTGDIKAPQKTAEHDRIEKGVLAAIIGALVPDRDAAERVLAQVYSPLCKWADRIACAQEALLFQPGAADWTMPPADLTGIGVTRSLVAETLPLFWPRPCAHGPASWIVSVRRMADLIFPALAEPDWAFRAAQVPTIIGMWPCGPSDGG